MTLASLWILTPYLFQLYFFFNSIYDTIIFKLRQDSEEVSYSKTLIISIQNFQNDLESFFGSTFSWDMSNINC